MQESQWALSPTPGLSATYGSEHVFTIGTHGRYGVQMADVLRLKPWESHAGQGKFVA